jgi:hypothetical protein
MTEFQEISITDGCANRSIWQRQVVPVRWCRVRVSGALASPIRSRDPGYCVRAAVNDPRTRTVLLSMPEPGIKHVRMPGPRE